MSNDCIFCKIVSGDIPSVTIYENDEFKVILDRFPASRGHILIVPKAHIENIYEIEPECAGRLFELTTRFASILKRALGNEGLNIIQNNGAVAGQTVFHYHLHMIPRYKDDGMQLGWTNNEDITIEELEDYAKQIKKEM